MSIIFSYQNLLLSYWFWVEFYWKKKSLNHRNGIDLKSQRFASPLGCSFPFCLLGQPSFPLTLYHGSLVLLAAGLGGPYQSIDWFNQLTYLGFSLYCFFYCDKKIHKKIYHLSHFKVSIPVELCIFTSLCQPSHSADGSPAARGARSAEGNGRGRTRTRPEGRLLGPWRRPGHA